MTAGPRSDREWRVRDVLWEGPEEGMTLGPIHEALRPGTGWSRNTVHTYLTRMAAKGLIAVEGEAPPHSYRAAVTREACAAAEGRTLLERAYQGSAGKLVAAFVREHTLTPEEREELRALLDEMEV